MFKAAVAASAMDRLVHDASYVRAQADIGIAPSVFATYDRDLKADAARQRLMEVVCSGQRCRAVSRLPKTVAEDRIGH